MAQSGHVEACPAMSAFGGQADIAQVTARCPVLTQSGHRALGFANRDLWNVGREQGHSGLILANFTTLPHFSTSSEMIFPKAAGEPPSMGSILGSGLGRRALVMHERAER